MGVIQTGALQSHCLILCIQLVIFFQKYPGFTLYFIDDCLMNAWRLPDECLMSAWQSPHLSPRTFVIRGKNMWCTFSNAYLFVFLWIGTNQHRLYAVLQHHILLNKNGGQQIQLNSYNPLPHHMFHPNDQKSGTTFGRFWELCTRRPVF